MNITIRISDELAEEIEKRRGDKSKADYYREIIEAHLRSLRSSESGMSAGEDNVSNSDLTRELADLKDELTHKEQIIKIMDGRVKDLQTQNGFLISEFQNLSRMNEKLLPPAPSPAPSPWWQFWKRSKE